MTNSSKDTRISNFLILVAVAALSTMMYGVPTYFNKPDREEVSIMIAKEAPMALRDTIMRIEESGIKVMIKQAEMHAILERLIRILESGHSEIFNFKKTNS